MYHFVSWCRNYHHANELVLFNIIHTFMQIRLHNSEMGCHPFHDQPILTILRMRQLCWRCPRTMRAPSARRRRLHLTYQKMGWVRSCAFDMSGMFGMYILKLLWTYGVADLLVEYGWWRSLGDSKHILMKDMKGKWMRISTWLGSTVVRRSA